MVVKNQEPSSVFLLRKSIGDVDMYLIIVELVDRLGRTNSVGHTPVTRLESGFRGGIQPEDG